MARPKLSNKMTTSIIAKALDMTNSKLIYWIQHGILPEPSEIDENGGRYFDQAWLEKARGIIDGRRF
jgi:DNA-binding transcriptional MerR regulator